MKLKLTFFIFLANLVLTLSLKVPGFNTQYSNSDALEAIQNVLKFNKSPASVGNIRFLVGSQDSDYENWLLRQGNFSFQGVLNNIGGISQSLLESEVSDGAVIASPSKFKPNYFFQWIRDSALTVRSLIHYLQDNDIQDKKITSIIEQYIENNYYLQRISNKLGKFDDIDKLGLGEPKFWPDCTAFNEPWGRPQNDGPGLRVSTISSYLYLLNENGLKLSNPFLKDAKFIYDSIIKPDLIFIIKNWRKLSFDLWEEINSIHFFTSMSQLRAIKDGLYLAETHELDEKFIGQLMETYESLKHFIEVDAKFSIPSTLYIIETPSLFSNGRRSGLDAAVLLASLHSHDLEIDKYSDVPFDINDYHILNTINAMTSDMRLRYPINRDKIGKPSVGAALGRYPEDIYDGVGTSEGNPWFISTLSAAEVIFKTIYKLLIRNQDLFINKYNQDFYGSFIKFDIDELELLLPYNSAKYNNALQNLFDFGDSYLKVVKDHADKDGHLSEQFNKYTGYMQGAKDLTWSYSAFWNAIRWRTKALELLQSNQNH